MYDSTYTRYLVKFRDRKNGGCQDWEQWGMRSCLMGTDFRIRKCNEFWREAAQQKECI